MFSFSNCKHQVTIGGARAPLCLAPKNWSITLAVLSFKEECKQLELPTKIFHLRFTEILQQGSSLFFMVDLCTVHLC